MALTDTLTTREALRRAVLDDIIARCELAAVPIEGGPLDGIAVVSMGVLRDQVTGSLMVELPAPSDRHAEVRTPAVIVTSAICPECGLPVEIIVNLSPALTVDNDGAELSVKAKSKARVHVHGQLPLPLGSDGQVGMDIVIDDLRLRILRAVDDVGADHLRIQSVDEAEPGPPPTLDAIAMRLGLATESDRADLEESLYAYAELEEPLVSILSVVGAPIEYVLTEAGEALVERAEPDGDDESEDDPE